MAIPKLMVVFLLVLSLTASRPATYDVADCSGFEFKTELTKAPNQELSKLIIKASGGKRPYHYVLLDGKNNLVSKDFTISEFDNLKQGRYRCIVSDGNDCTKEQYIEVK